MFQTCRWGEQYLSENRLRSSAGLTLIELMLSIGILAIVLVMIAGSFNAVIHSKAHGEARLDVDRQGRAILWELSNEIRGAVQTPLRPATLFHRAGQCA